VEWGANTAWYEQQAGSDLQSGHRTGQLPPCIVLRIWTVQKLACIHERVLASILPFLVPLQPSISASSASVCIADYWEHQATPAQAKEQTGESASRKPLGGGRGAGEPESEHVGAHGNILFLQPVYVSEQAAVLLNCAPTPSGCAPVLAQQLQALPTARDPNPLSPLQPTPTLKGLQAVMLTLAHHTLHRNESGSSTSSSATPSPRHSADLKAAPVEGDHAAVKPTLRHYTLHKRNNNSQAYLPLKHTAHCGGGLVAAVHAAYCTAHGGSLDPALILIYVSLSCLCNVAWPSTLHLNISPLPAPLLPHTSVQTPRIICRVQLCCRNPT